MQKGAQHRAASTRLLLLSVSCKAGWEVSSQLSTHCACANIVEFISFFHLQITVFAKETFLIPLHASTPIAITWKLFALCNWEGMGRASKSLTFSSKSFLCPSGLVKFGQAFLLPFGPWQITHHFRFGMVKRKGTVVPPAAERLKCSSYSLGDLGLQAEHWAGIFIWSRYRTDFQGSHPLQR